MRKNYKLIPLLLVLLLTLTACWDHVEISDMIIIAGIGLDTDDSGDGYRATVEFVKPGEDESKAADSGIVEGKGDTLYGALQDAMLATGGDIFGNHCKVVVIGDSLARQGINPVVEIILRSPDFRKTVDVLIAENRTADSVLKGKTSKGGTISFELAKILSKNEKTIKNTVATGVYRIHEALLSDCPVFAAPAVTARENNDEEALLADGGAVFVSDQLQGFLDGDSMKLYNLITGGGETTVLIDSPAPVGHPVEVELSKVSAKQQPSLAGDELTMNIELTADATLKNAVLAELDIVDPQTAKLMQDSISERLSADIGKLIAQVQTLYAADIFGFYRAFEDSYRQRWPELRENWEASFRDMEIDVNVSIELSGSGLIGDYEPEKNSRSGANALP